MWKSSVKRWPTATTLVFRYNTTNSIQVYLSYMLVDFHILILHLTSSHYYMNNLKHIPVSYSCDSRTVLTDMARYLCRILFAFFCLLKLSHELYSHLRMCSLLYLLNMCSLLKCELFLQLLIIIFVILHVCIMLAFMFCEINYIYPHCASMNVNQIRHA